MAKNGKPNGRTKTSVSARIAAHTPGAAGRKREGRQVSLVAAEQDHIRAHPTRISQLKLELANVALQMADLELRKHEIVDALRAETRRYEDDLRLLASSKGIDPNQPFAFDPENMTLTALTGG
jgi:hypothetical protein